MERALESRTGVDGPVTVIKKYGVPVEEAERFVEVYLENARMMAGRTGFIGSRLHRAVADGPEARFVHVAEWSSGIQLDRATADPEWRASLHDMFANSGLHITSEPGAYRV